MRAMDPKDTVTQFTAQVERFVTSPHVNEQEPVRRFLAAVAPRGDERALDVACGPGLLEKAFAPHVREIVGVDLTPAMVVKAVAIDREAGISNAQFEVADALRLPFATNALDLVLARPGAPSHARPARAVREMARVLCPGGRLGVFDITTPEITEESTYHDLVERLRDPSHARALPLSELAEMVGLAGLELDKIETMDYAQDVEDWIARAEQSADDAKQARQLIAAAIGTRKFGAQEGVARRGRQALVQRAMGDYRGDKVGVASTDSRSCVVTGAAEAGEDSPRRDPAPSFLTHSPQVIVRASRSS